MGGPEGRGDPLAALRGLSLAEVCDLAEVTLRRNMERDDMLSLLAALAEVADYEPPSERVPDMLAEQSELNGRARDPELRRAQVTAFLLAAGGD